MILKIPSADVEFFDPFGICLILTGKHPIKIRNTSEKRSVVILARQDTIQELKKGKTI